jgi:hypothetical protein
VAATGVEQQHGDTASRVPPDLSMPKCARLAGSWQKRWKKSSWKKDDGSDGDFSLTAGKWYGDEEADKGIQTGPDSKFFALYTALPKKVDNTGKDLVLQVRGEMDWHGLSDRRSHRMGGDSASSFSSARMACRHATAQSPLQCVLRTSCIAA